MIDTNMVAKIQLGTYEAEGKQIRAMAKPAVAVNKRGFLNGDYFYNELVLIADEEDRSKFKKPPVVIEVYRISDGSYSHSFYLPGDKGSRLADFAVHGNRLIALYGRYLVAYQLPEI